MPAFRIIYKTTHVRLDECKGAGGRWSSGKYVGTACLRAAGSSPTPLAVWVFWRLIWCTESLDRGLILVCRFSSVSSRVCIPVTAHTRSCLQGWMCKIIYLIDFLLLGFLQLGGFFFL
jgi:hypothetical protein